MVLPPTDCKTMADIAAHPKFTNAAKRAARALARAVRADPAASKTAHAGFVVGLINYIYRIEPQGVVHCVKAMPINRYEHLRRSN